MNNTWSTAIQRPGTLYCSRRLRFADSLADRWCAAFAIPAGSAILELGCGPGALAQSLARWYPNCTVTAIDRDSGFLQFAAETVGSLPNLRFAEADATALPYADGSFDVTISNTVQEHVAPDLFFGEQHRVLRPGGVCLVLSSRRGISRTAPVLAEASPFEREIWQRIEPYARAADEANAVCAYPMTEQELPRAMAAHGFGAVSTDYITVNLTPDSAETDEAAALAMLEANRQTALDGIDTIPHIAPGVVSADELAQLRAEIEAKHDRRLAQYRRGEPQWDAIVNVIMVVRGIR